MKTKNIFPVFLTLLLIFSIYSNVSADRKKFARSYTFHTLPAGAMELEIWQTARIDKGAGDYYRWQPRFEIEYGVTDRLTAAFYFNFNQVKSYNNSTSSKPMELNTSSIEFRYRLANQDDYFIDPALYFELGYGGDKIFYEPKILLSKQMGDFSAVMNFVSELERNIPNSETETKFEISMGLAYDITSNFSIGLEFRNHRNYEEFYGKEENQASFLGPTISFHSEKVYFVINFLSQISGSPSTLNSLDLRGHEKYELRTILGIEL